MSFLLTKDRLRSAIDPDSKARMVIDSTPQIEFYDVKFWSPEIFLQKTLMIRPKFSNYPPAVNDPNNPRIMISCSELNQNFDENKMYDIESNTHLVNRLVSMIAFINKHSPLAPSPFLWSDYNKIRAGTLLFRMPSDEALLRLSRHPEQGPEGGTGA